MHEKPQNKAKKLSRPPLRYFGSKWELAPWLIEFFPPHRVYVEPFGGGASVLLRKPRSFAEIYNDIDGEIVNVFRVIRSQPERLASLLEMTPFAREEFNVAYQPSSDPLEQARRTIVRSFMGHGSNANNPEQKTGFRANSNRSNSTAASDWRNYPQHIQTFSERLRGVVIENRDAFEVMAQQDSEETLFLIDPPYVLETRNIKHGYRFEMADTDHAKLRDFIKSLKGMVILCGYDNAIYSDLGWETRKCAARADGCGERTEVIWLNPSCVRAQSQTSFDL